ncbi:MAG TPA: YceI family protein [Balneolaceae bacterium]|nr:YceI family protein [Balneolaceae bacterium]
MKLVTRNIDFCFRLLLMMMVLLGAIIPLRVNAQDSAALGALKIEPGGKVWIKGSAKVTDYRCQAEKLSGNGIIENTKEPQQSIRGHSKVSIIVSIPVHALKCGKKPMNKDMYHALKANKFPRIKYQLLKAAQGDSASLAQGSWIPIKVKGMLEIAGVWKATTLNVQGKLLSPDRFRVKGTKDLSMKTFNVKPPTAFFGLIKASSKLTLSFNVVIQMKNDNKDTSFLSH